MDKVFKVVREHNGRLSSALASGAARVRYYDDGSWAEAPDWLRRRGLQSLVVPRKRPKAPDQGPEAAL